MPHKSNEQHESRIWTRLITSSLIAGGARAIATWLLEQIHH